MSELRKDNEYIFYLNRIIPNSDNVEFTLEYFSSLYSAITIQVFPEKIVRISFEHLRVFFELGDQSYFPTKIYKKEKQSKVKSLDDGNSFICLRKESIRNINFLNLVVEFEELIYIKFTRKGIMRQIDRSI